MELKEYKVCFIVPWFGEYPWWLKFFLKSVECNLKYNWLIISDRKPELQLPINVKFVEYSVADLQNLIKQKLELTPQIINPYKLCDFKPTYGTIFSDYLKKYDYWGYCDTDLIFGNIEQFIDPFLTDGVDVLSPDSEFFPGHFCLFKNKPEVNSLFKLTGNYKHVFESDKVFFFDEFIFSNGIICNSEEIERFVKRKIQKHKQLLNLKKSILTIIPRFLSSLVKKVWKPLNLVDFNSVLMYAEKNEGLEIVRKNMYLSDVHFYCENKEQWKLCWREGSLYMKEQELLYFHFQLSKRNDQFEIKENEEGFELTLN